MDKTTKIAITLTFVFVLVGGLYLMSGWISNATGYVIKSDDSSVISTCLNEKEVVMYTAPNCPECNRQEKEFSEIISGFSVVDCSQSPRDCLVLSKLPAIEYQKSLYYGFKSVDETRKIVKC